MRRHAIILILFAGGLLLPFAGSAHAFFNRYNFSFITEESGLPHNFIDDICLDDRGTVWVATHDGIARYDGYRCISYNTRTTPVRLKSDFVHCLRTDRFGRLWIGSEEGLDLLSLTDYAQIDAAAFLPEALQPLAGSLIESLYRDGSDRLWISTSRDLWCLTFGDDGSVSEWHRLEQESVSPVHAVVDLEGVICAGIDNNVCRIVPAEGHRLLAEPFSELLQPYSEDWRIRCMKRDGQLLWIGTNRGLFKYDCARRRLDRYRYSNHRPGMLSQAYVTAIDITAAGDVLVATLNGLNVYDRDTDSFDYIRQNSENPDQSLNCNFINCLLADGERIWAGTETGGLDLLVPRSLPVHTWQHDPHTAWSISPSPVNMVCEDRAGNLWVGTVAGGLNKKTAGDNRFDHLLFDPRNPASISNNSLRGLLVDSENHLWAYTWGVGINELDLNIPDNRTFRRHMREDGLGLESDFLSSACEDLLHNGIWFGGTRGLHFYSRETRRFTRVLFDQSDNEFDAVGAMLIDRRNRLWVGTSEGVFIVDLHSFADTPARQQHFDYVYLRHKLTAPVSLQIEKINCLLEDRDGTIWLGAKGNGLYRFTGESEGAYTFRNYTTHDGLPSNTIVGMAEDRTGQIWLFTDYGLSQLDPATLAFTNYTHGDGLPDNRFYANACCYSARHDLLYFGTGIGLAAFSPEAVTRREIPTEVVMTTLEIAGTTVYPPTDAETTYRPTGKGRLRLHERNRNFALGFSTLNYGKGHRVRYAYRMRGYEDQWSETAPGEHSAKYHLMPPGHYRFEVRATDEKGHWSDRVTQMEVVIVPYFYKSWWFVLLALALLAAGVQSLYRWRVRRYRTRQKRLEEEVDARTRELKQKNERLEVMARYMEEITEEKIAFFTNITHEFRTPVTLIDGPIRRALEASENPAVQEQLQIASRNSSYLLSLVNQLLDFRKIEADRVTLNCESVDFVRFVEHLLMPFEVFARERRIDIAFLHRFDTPYRIFDAENIRKVLINLISNAVKFTPDGGRIRIYAGTTVEKPGGGECSELVFIDVCDSGTGIVPEESERIFDKFYQSKSTAKYPAYGQSSTGIGLFLCRKIVALHGGHICAANHPGGGARFRVLLPLDRGTAPEALPAVPQSAVATDTGDAAATDRGETVLIVEDNADMRAYIRSILDGDYRLVEAQHGAEALERLQQEPVDLIVSDLMMPTMDGNELSRRVKADLATSHIPFLMLTAMCSDEQEKLSYTIGVDEYLRKPFDAEVLRLRIRNIFAARHRYRERFAREMTPAALPMSAGSRDSHFLEKACALLREHGSDSAYNLERFVRDMGYSKTLVNAKLQTLTGHSIGQFMKNYRLNAAGELLAAGGGYSVSEIAYAVGFNDPKYFTKCFKAHFGVLPSEYPVRK